MSFQFNAPSAPNDLPPRAAELAMKHTEVLRNLPPVLAASLLTQIRGYDWMFPAESQELEGQLSFLAAPPSPDTLRILNAFRGLPVPASTTEALTKPESFLQSFAAKLWQVHANEQFRQCGEEYGTILAAVRSRFDPPKERIAIVLAGQGARRSNASFFAKLRQHGTYFPQVDDTHAVAEAATIFRERAATLDRPYSHWWIDGGPIAAASSPTDAHLSYTELQAVREALAQRVRTAMKHPAAGPENLRSYMMGLQPADLPGLPVHQDLVMQHFAVRVLCDGSGTQNLSTSFVQWSAREALRRAQPETLVVRFAPRACSVDFLYAHAQAEELDAEGALIDADMGAYYTWLNLQRLQSQTPPRFVALAENGQGAVAIGPGMSAATIATNRATLRNIVDWMNG